MAHDCFQIGSSYVSAVDWYMSTKFGLQMDFCLLTRVPSPNTKPGVGLSLCRRGYHLENGSDVITSPRVVRYAWMECGMLTQNDITTIRRSQLKPKIMTD